MKHISHGIAVVTLVFVLLAGCLEASDVRASNSEKAANEATEGYITTVTGDESTTIVETKDIPLEDRERSTGREKYETDTYEEMEQEETAVNIQDITLNYTSARDILMQYVTKDETTVKILNNNVLYSYNVETGQIAKEYTFPESMYYSGEGYWASQSDFTAFIREESGLLYFGYNEYYNAYSEDEVMNIIVYDLEKGRVAESFQKKGYILNSVGADKKGNIYIGTDDIWKSTEESGIRKDAGLILMTEEGELLTEKRISYPINEFSGFCEDGTFYYVDEYMAYSLYGYANLMGRLMKGKFQGGEVTLSDQYLDYVKNIFFRNYRMPVEILNDAYLVTCSGQFYPLNSIGDGTWTRSLYAPKDLEMGSEYDYIYNAGVNSVIHGDSVYTLYDNDTVMVYSMSSGKQLKMFEAKGKVFNMKSYQDGVIALETDGTHFFYEIIHSADMKTMETVVYNMNEFAPYKGRGKNDILKKYIAATPADYSATLYAAQGSGKAPYKESTLSATTRTNALKLSNYYRWLAGLTGFDSASNKVWSNAAKGAVLLSASNFSHSSSRPSDMSEEFYQAALEATSSSSIAMNYYANQYKIINTIRLWMNDTGYTVTGHRNYFLTRNATNIAYGFFGGYACQTVEYTGDPNPSGTAVKNNNEAAYAWPAAGDFPAEDLDTTAYWTVNLNTDKLNLLNTALKVTITDLDTGVSEQRTSSADGLYATSFWGRYISFAPPTLKAGTSSYAGKRYKIVLSNLTDAEGMPAELIYTVRFFTYAGTHVIDGVTYHLDKYGLTSSSKRLTPSITLSNTASGVKVSWKKTAGAKRYFIYRNGKRIASTKKASYIDKRAKKNGAKYRYKVVAYSGSTLSPASKEKVIYYMSRPRLTSVKGKKGGKCIVRWKKNKKASGYQIRYKTGKKTRAITVSGGKKVTKTIRKLKKGKAYQVTIRAFKKVGKVKYYSSWSKRKKVTGK